MVVTEPTSERLKTLLAQYKCANIAAFSHFFKETRRTVFAYALSRTRSVADAEDIVQETYFRVHKYILSYDEAYPPIAWLLGIAKNVWVDRLKSTLIFEPIDSHMAYAEDQSLAQEARDFLNAVVAELSPEEQEILNRRILSQDSFEKLSKEMNLTSVSARQRFSRLIKKLRSKLQDT